MVEITILTDFNVLNLEIRMEWTRYKNYKSKFQREHSQFDHKLDDVHLLNTGMSDVMYC
jgi:hypothetical protein